MYRFFKSFRSTPDAARSLVAAHAIGTRDEPKSDTYAPAKRITVSMKNYTECFGTLMSGHKPEIVYQAPKNIKWLEDDERKLLEKKTIENSLKSCTELVLPKTRGGTPKAVMQELLPEVHTITGALDITALYVSLLTLMKHAKSSPFVTSTETKEDENTEIAMFRTRPKQKHPFAAFLEIIAEMKLAEKEERDWESQVDNYPEMNEN